MYYITLIKVVEGFLRKALHSKQNIQQPFVNLLYYYSSSLTVTTCWTFKPLATEWSTSGSTKRSSKATTRLYNVWICDNRDTVNISSVTMLGLVSNTCQHTSVATSTMSADNRSSTRLLTVSRDTGGWDARSYLSTLRTRSELFPYILLLSFANLAVCFSH